MNFTSVASNVWLVDLSPRQADEQSNARELRVARFSNGKITRRNRVIGAVRPHQMLDEDKRIVYIYWHYS